MKKASATTPFFRFYSAIHLFNIPKVKHHSYSITADQPAALLSSNIIGPYLFKGD
ncbi:MAG: hypothetical protein JW913_00185 [Chitinispirillaceae bacterium]|nr:hypothetical protein [Chitinispirillaceae bacterium]